MYPTIHNIKPFDSSLGTTITFTWNGDQIYKARCIIKENETGNTVYDGTVDTMKAKYPIPANSGLVNGTYYVCYITVFDIDNAESSVSDGKPFYCYSTPTFNLSIKDNDVIRTSSYEPVLNYSQAENEELNYYCITLYSYQKTILQSSGNVYNAMAPLTHLITSLENATQYYIRATGETVHGMTVYTDYILFTVAYTQAQVFSTLEVNNLPEIGGIELRSNIISTIGNPDHEVIYIDGDKADLRDNSVSFDAGFEVYGDFSLVIKLTHPNINKPFLHLINANDTTCISCFYREGTFDNSDGKKGVIGLKASSCSDIYYVLYSNYFNIPGNSECICYCISRVGNYFDTKVVVEKI